MPRANDTSPSYVELCTWIHSLPLGKLQITLPLPVSADDADEIEQLFALVMRQVRRRIPPKPEDAL